MSSQTLPRPRKASPKKRQKAASRRGAATGWLPWWPLLAAVAITFATVKTAEILPLMGADGLLNWSFFIPTRSC